MDSVSVLVCCYKQAVGTDGVALVDRDRVCRWTIVGQSIILRPVDEIDTDRISCHREHLPRPGHGLARVVECLGLRWSTDRVIPGIRSTPIHGRICLVRPVAQIRLRHRGPVRYQHLDIGVDRARRHLEIATLVCRRAGQCEVAIGVSLRHRIKPGSPRVEDPDRGARERHTVAYPGIVVDKRASELWGRRTRWWGRVTGRVGWIADRY